MDDQNLNENELASRQGDATPSEERESGLILPPSMDSNRRSFLRALGVAGAGALVLPRMAAAAPAKPKPAPKATSKAASGKAAPTTKGAMNKTNAQKAQSTTPTQAVTKEVKEAANAITPAKKAERIKVAIVGPGSQGRNLLLNALKIDGVDFVAVCDIWDYSSTYAANILNKYRQKETWRSEPKVYSDLEDMLEKEPGIQAVIIATPDWMHSPQTVTCLKAGKHVYCEKEMSNTIEGAAAMVTAARETGKLLQIGHQRRSNPRYWHVYEMIHGPDKAIGRLTHMYGQWNRPKRLELGWPKGKEISKDVLDKYGYDTMERFRNWRWYHQYSGGAIADLGSHQVDIFSWFLRGNPENVLAAGGNDYYKQGEWYDHVMAIYEYGKGEGVERSGPARGFYQVLNTTGWGGYYEVFMGDQGVIEVSEDTKKGFYVRDPGAPPRKWEDDAAKVNAGGIEGIALVVGETLRPGGRPKEEKLAEASEKAPHQLHLENFFNAVREGGKLSCPPEIGFETCVTVLKTNEAVAAKKQYTYDPSEFTVAKA